MIRVATRLGCTANWVVLQIGLYCKLGCTANWVVLQIGLYLLNLHSPAASANLPALVNHAYLSIFFLFGKLPPIGGDGGGLVRRMYPQKIRVRRSAASAWCRGGGREQTNPMRRTCPPKIVCTICNTMVPFSTIWY